MIIGDLAKRYCFECLKTVIVIAFEEIFRLTKFLRSVRCLGAKSSQFSKLRQFRCHLVDPLLSCHVLRQLAGSIFFSILTPKHPLHSNKPLLCEMYSRTLLTLIIDRARDIYTADEPNASHRSFGRGWFRCVRFAGVRRNVETVWHVIVQVSVTSSLPSADIVWVLMML